MKPSAVAIVLLLGLCQPAAAAQDIIAECRELVMAYAYYRDRPDADGVAQLFTEQASMSLLGQTFKGREAIRQRIVAGQDGPAFRHLMTTIHIEPVDERTARGVSYVTVFQGKTRDLPIAPEGFMATGEYRDEFVKTSAGWKIASREFVPTVMATDERDVKGASEPDGSSGPR